MTDCFKIIDYYSKKVSLNYAKKINKYCNQDKHFKKFIKLILRYELSILNSNNNEIELISDDNFLKKCKLEKKKYIKDLGEEIINLSKLENDNEIITNINSQFKILKKKIYDINKIIEILNLKLKEKYYNYLNIYDNIFIPEIINFENKIIIENKKNISLLNDNKNPFIAEYSNSEISNI